MPNVNGEKNRIPQPRTGERTAGRAGNSSVGKRQVKGGSQPYSLVLRLVDVLRNQPVLVNAGRDVDRQFTGDRRSSGRPGSSAHRAHVAKRKYREGHAVLLWYYPHLR